MSESNPDSQLIAEFVSITNSSTYLAEQYLSRNNNDLVEAVEDFYANSEPSQKSETKKSFSSSKSTGSGIKTFRDLNDEDDDEEDDKTNTNFFTGGEKSGLQVEDPNKDKDNDRSIIDQIFQKAREQMQQPDDRPSASQDDQPSPIKFSGKGFKLGDGNEPSQIVEDPTTNSQKFKPSKVTREITFWKQGFTVGDGPLHRYDDPRNSNVLQELNQGRVPMSILDVEFGQDVDVSVYKKTDEDWSPPKRKIGGYHGTGHRLGSPVPGEVLVNNETSFQPDINKPNGKDKDEEKDEDEGEGEGDSTVQIRFANGKKTSHKFNSSDSILKVYEFVRNHEYNSEPTRSFTLSHAFPVKPIEESNEITIADAKLKNAVIVQRWK
ncbi:UBX domain-containing protein, putative [Candida dubliniensis CD36]|uniref:UBX domain-containing protein, putative n=1 Tax=Candida dubliniensis (strain CD36 / ATCC MYA-646 / CBS 7987 / NCPF 3949 / NRRL Y-17841) TaxID=573826 RepID=B9WKZ0_CANDC|nr:UBX domain-containing protein, putative [Candida dubliniensis CD36]CAX39691.1 UBX domain-containing protein, putative [Candida dubliniensis CD36]